MPDSAPPPPAGQSNTPPSPGPPHATPPGGPPPPPPPPGYRPPPGAYPVAYAAAPARSGGGVLSRIVAGIVSSLLLISLAANVYFFLVISSTMQRPLEQRVYRAGDKNYQAVILPINGTITEGNYEFVRVALKEMEAKPPLAIILRVDSPGGAVGASDRIWHELSEFKKQHQTVIVSSYGSYAASGGYYVSCLSDYIVAEPTCLTGSIGVIAQAFTVEGLLEKVGVTPEIIASSEANEKDALSPFHPWDETDRAKLREILDQAHNRFVKIVDEGRAGLNEQQVRELATGAPYTADKALELKLVDEIGYLENAIAQAEKLCKLPAGVKLNVRLLSARASLADLLGFESNAAGKLDGLPTDLRGESVREWLIETTTPRLEYRFDLLQP